MHLTCTESEPDRRNAHVAPLTEAVIPQADHIDCHFFRGRGWLGAIARPRGLKQLRLD